MQCLAEFGFTRAQRHGLPETDRVDSRCRRLCAALVSLGPVFSAFGIYLASRADLLLPQQCRELAAIPDCAEATPIENVRLLILQELGCPLTEAYLTFEEDPFESRLLFQTHHAQLKNGMAVTVKVAHPEFNTHLLCDVEQLALLEYALTSVRADFPVGRVIADFRRALEEQMDFALEADAMEALASNSLECETLTCPAIHRSFCSSKVVTAEFLSGPTLADVIACFPERQSSESTSRKLPYLDPINLASALCCAWLNQSLLGRIFPTDPRPENILVLSDGKIACTGNFAGFSADVKSSLWNYLLAAAAEDPDRACSFLLKEMEQGPSRTNQDELARKFRQVVPFRDGGWNVGNASDSLAERLFVQWRLASESGCYPSRHLLSFYRGLFLIASAAERLAPQHDSLLRGLQQVRWVELITQFQQMGDLRGLSNDLGKYASMAMEFPGKIDHLLTLASEGDMRLKLRMIDRADHRRQKNSLVVSIALLLMLPTVVLLSHHFARNGGVGVWAERTGAFLYVLIGAVLLRIGSRSR